MKLLRWTLIARGKGIWLASGLLLLAVSAAAALPDQIARCAAIPDREQRWRCYDELSPETASAQGADEPGKDECGAGYTALSRQWNTRPDCESKLYHLLPYRQNYLIARYSNSPNSEPTSVNFGKAPDEKLQRTELEFQLSLKVKVAEQIANAADVWVAYTQQSNWQAFNSANSRPFRETDYEPELIVSLPLRTQANVLGLTPRLLNVGFVHQSNGQSDPLSRSWNRVYLQLGADRNVETDPPYLGFLLRAWYRLPEGSADDNPDIQHYLGYGDLVLFWRHGDYDMSAVLRNNLQSQNNRGSLRLDWSAPITRIPRLTNVSVFPLTQRELRFYVQMFTGYGETLIDYNHYQTTIGIGIMVTDWM